MNYGLTNLFFGVLTPQSLVRHLRYLDLRSAAILKNAGMMKKAADSRSIYCEFFKLRTTNPTPSNINTEFNNIANIVRMPLLDSSINSGTPKILVVLLLKRKIVNTGTSIKKNVTTKDTHAKD